MTDDRRKPTPPNIDPAQCPFRDTCPHLMQCVTEFLLGLAREDWGMDEDKSGDDHDSDGDATSVG